MRIFVWNTIKVFTAFLIGIGLLALIKDLPIVLISFIQMVVFTCLYSCLDLIYDKIRARRLMKIVEGIKFK